LGTAVNLAGMALSGYGAYKALTGGSSAPAMLPPPGAGGNLPIPYDPNMGKRSIFRDDPNVADRLKGYAIDDRFLRTYHRAPKGFVVLHDSQGAAFALPKKIAMSEGMWHPAKKPPISVGDWHKLMGANRVVKKFREMEKKAMRIANFRAPHRSSGLRVVSLPGKSIVAKKG
jgi:hypothetical protein